MSACAVQELHRLLVGGLDRHTPDVALLRRHPDGASVGSIVLVPPHEGAHVLGRQQLHAMAHGFEGAAPMVGATACFHDDARRLARSKELGELGPRQLLAPDFPAQRIDPMNLKDILGNVGGVSRSIHGGTSVYQWLNTNFHFGTRCRLTRGPNPFVSTAQSRLARVGGVHTISWRARAVELTAWLTPLRSNIHGKSDDEARSRAPSSPLRSSAPTKSPGQLPPQPRPAVYRQSAPPLAFSRPDGGLRAL